MPASSASRAITCGSIMSAAFCAYHACTNPHVRLPAMGDRRKNGSRHKHDWAARNHHLRCWGLLMKEQSAQPTRLSEIEVRQRAEANARIAALHEARRVRDAEMRRVYEVEHQAERERQRSVQRALNEAARGRHVELERLAKAREKQARAHENRLLGYKKRTRNSDTDPVDDRAIKRLFVSHIAGGPAR